MDFAGAESPSIVITKATNRFVNPISDHKTNGEKAGNKSKSMNPFE